MTNMLAIETPKVGIVVNPFFVFTLFFSTVVVCYHFGWSGLYPPISTGLWIFLVISLLTSLLLGFLLRRELRRVIRKPKSAPMPRFWHWLLVSLYVVELLYAGGVPIYWIATGREFIYEDFGLPTVHVFVMTFGSFFSLVKYNEFLNAKRGARSRSLLWAVLPLVFDVLIVTRGLFILTIISWLVIYLLNRRISWKHVAGMCGAAFVVLMGFGIAGDFRVASRNDQEFVENIIFEIGDATDKFRDSDIPPATFWAYVYATSPLANFQNTVDRAPERIGTDNFFTFIVSEFLPDFVSKRILGATGLERSTPILITPTLTVSTIYAAAYVYLGWTGVCMLFSFLMSLACVYIYLLRFNNFSIASLAALNTLMAFCVFDNMIYFSGISLQVAWPLLLSLSSRSANFPRNVLKISANSRSPVKDQLQTGQAR